VEGNTRLSVRSFTTGDLIDQLKAGKERLACASLLKGHRAGVTSGHLHLKRLRIEGMEGVKYSKLSTEQTEAILSLLDSGLSALAVSKRLGHQYKTVWILAKKLRGGQSSDAYTSAFRIGDTVSRLQPDGRIISGCVTSFCPGRAWVRVKTDDGRSRIWLAENLANDEAQIRMILGTA
jgi:hypothetical protein